MNLSAHTLTKLKQLQTGIAREIEKRERSSRSELIARLARMASDEGLSFAEIFPGVVVPDVVPGRRSRVEVPPPRPKVKVPPKYCHPSNRALAWSGRGKKPAWVAIWQAGGGSMDALANAAERVVRQTCEPVLMTSGADFADDERDGQDD